VALQTHQTHLVTDQHAWISRTVRLMTRHAALEANGGVLENEGTALIAVALEARRLVAEGNAHGLRHGARMGIVAVGTGHRAFGKAMLVGLLKRRPDREMARGALRVNVRRFLKEQRPPARAVNGVALKAPHGVLGMAGQDASHVRRIVPVAALAGKVPLGWFQLGGLLDIFDVRAFCVFCPSTVAGLARHGLPATRMICFDGVVWRLSKSRVNLFVTELTGIRADVSRLESRSLGSGCGRGRGLGWRSGGRLRRSIVSQQDTSCKAHEPRSPAAF
jgi:hypothetical protein